VVNTAGFLYFIVLLIRPSIRLALEYMSLQCAADFRSGSSGVMWSWRCAPTVRRAAALMADCRRSRSQLDRPARAMLHGDSSPVLT